MLIFRFSIKTGMFQATGISEKSEHLRPAFRPPVDITHRDNTYVVKMDIPGAEASEISIEANETEVIITGSILSEHRRGPFRLIERPNGTFGRVLSFPGKIVPDKIEAVLADGVLTIKIPAHDTDRISTKIEIRLEDAD